MKRSGSARLPGDHPFLLAAALTTLAVTGLVKVIKRLTVDRLPLRSSP